MLRKLLKEVYSSNKNIYLEFMWQDDTNNNQVQTDIVEKSHNIKKYLDQKGIRAYNCFEDLQIITIVVKDSMVNEIINHMTEKGFEISDKTKASIEFMNSDQNNQNRGSRGGQPQAINGAVEL